MKRSPVSAAFDDMPATKSATSPSPSGGGGVAVVPGFTTSTIVTRDFETGTVVMADFPELANGAPKKTSPKRPVAAPIGAAPSGRKSRRIANGTGADAPGAIVKRPP